MQKYQDMNNEKFLQLSINNAQMLEMTKNVEKILKELRISWRKWLKKIKKQRLQLIKVC